MEAITSCEWCACFDSERLTTQCAASADRVRRHCHSDGRKSKHFWVTFMSYTIFYRFMFMLHTLIDTHLCHTQNIYVLAICNRRSVCLLLWHLVKTI